jgi:hypothetical protein
MPGRTETSSLSVDRNILPGTDDELSSLLGSIRRHVLDVPPHVWDPTVREAAKAVSAALADRLDPGRRPSP